MDYKGLKKFISSLLNTPADSLKALGLPPVNVEDDRSKLLQSQKAAFFFKLERELEKVKLIYNDIGIFFFIYIYLYQKTVDQFILSSKGE